MSDSTEQITSPVSHNTLVDKVRWHHQKRPILMVFLTALLLVGVSAGSIYAYVAITRDRAVFNSNISADNPVRQHILRVDGAGDLVATLRDKTENDVDRVRFNLSLLNESGELLQNVISSTKGQKVQIKHDVAPGDYTFIVKSEDELTEMGASYTLRIDYPNDVANFEDKIAPTVEIGSPELGGTVKGVFTISGTAGDETELSQVAVKLDDGPWVVANGTDQWQLAINSEDYSNGQRIITVQATDASGNVQSEQTLVNFDNDITLPDTGDTGGDTGSNGGDTGSGGDTGNDGGSTNDGTNPGPSGPTSDGGNFFVDFANNSGLDKFRVGVYHRNIGSQVLGQAATVWGDSNAGHGGSWTGDHDLACGAPSTQRALESSKNGGPSDGDFWSPDPNFNVDKVVYTCRDHLMTSMGDVDGYSIVWFSPNQTFNRSEVKKVSWDVNVTDLKGRQWWEVSVVPKGGKFLATVDWLAGTAGIDSYDRSAVIIGSGPFGSTVNMTTNGQNRYDGWQSICGSYGLDPEACNSKMIRRTFSITDNMNGTLTVDYGGMFTKTIHGQLPESFEVYFKDHNYTPDKDGMPVGHTWHWDNIAVQ